MGLAVERVTHKYEKRVYPAPMVLQKLVGELFGNVYLDRGVADGEVLPLPLCLRIHDERALHLLILRCTGNGNRLSQRHCRGSIGAERRFMHG